MDRIKISRLRKDGLKNLKNILIDLKTFNEMEVKVAIEMAEEFLKKGKRSDYNFLVAKGNGNLMGFLCFGPTPLTVHTYDLYWIAVSKKYQGKSIGKMLLEKCEKNIKDKGGKILIAETSSTKKYEKARIFYKKNGFKKAVEIKDFYKLRDNKIIYVKYINGGR